MPGRHRSVLLALTVAVSTMAVTALAGRAADATVARAAGDDRLGTAIALSTRAFPQASAVVLAASTDFPDALAAAPLAAAVSGPVLLNGPDRLDARVRDELRRLGAGTAYLVGGTSVLGGRIEDDLRSIGVEPHRVAGADRFATAAEAARLAVERWRSEGRPDAGARVLVALGRHDVPERAWPDALAAGALAGQARWPILLVRRGDVPAATNDALRDLGTDHAVVVGGPAAVSDRNAGRLAVDSWSRIGGDDRYETSVLLADEATRQGAETTTTVAATGADFPDGLAAGPAAHALGGVLVLVAPDDLVSSAPTKRWFEGREGRIGTVVVAGGKAAISDEVAGQIRFALSAAVLRAEEVAGGFEFPLYVTAPPGDDRLFVVEKPGRITVVEGAARSTFLDIRGQVSDDGERGLLGLAFHPEFATNGRYYIHYTDTAGDTRVVERRRDGSSRQLLHVDQPFSNHNGGMLQWGPDDRLYLALGDGGSGGDPLETGQDPSDLLGSIVRIDPSTGSASSWMYGLRNPWRFWIDESDGLLYIGDVGQGSWEEIDVTRWDARGTNFGWDVLEGTHCHEPSSGCDRSGKTMPVLEYATGTEGSCAVTGGIVYRGNAIPALRGQYLYSDWCGGFVRSFHWHDGVRSDDRDWTAIDVGNVPSFGTDGHGELYVTSSSTGSVYRIVAG